MKNRLSPVREIDAKAPTCRFWLRFAASRLLRVVLVLTLVSILAFALVSMAPLDPVDAYLGPNIFHISPEQRDLVVARWGLDQPPLMRYVTWVGHVFTGDLGVSPIFNQPVATVIATRFSASLALMTIAWTASGALGFCLGLVAGTWRRSWAAKIIRVYAYMLAAAPTFWIAIILLIVFGVVLGWTPICCAAPIGLTPDQISLGQRLSHIILPATALTFLGIAQITLYTCQETAEFMNSDVAIFARAQGASRWDILRRHAIRHAALPAITVQFAGIGELFGGSILAETVFTYPGLGQAAVAAGIRGDEPLLLGITLFSAAIVSIGNSIADALYHVIDPRITLAS
ncbi:ABC transporter permease [Telmatospirillum sp.]|uniref:ABC transporter permease n=1 Tax=Telmatospirillum sp. TaxID=2079197 RepID=UPI0028507D7C|nr:ABC transporter permease [Telmatospirillum sp.]MDR3434987.1 ABC transporter permease [Telmatospirillum sp.]